MSDPTLRLVANRLGDLDTVFRALADPTRRAVIQRLADGPASVSELAEPFDMALPSFVQHVRVLEESGLLHSKKVGRVRTCQLDSTALSSAERWITDRREVLEARLDALEEYLELTNETGKRKRRRSQ